jgi:malonyl-CoA O-methyltransferase
VTAFQVPSKRSVGRAFSHGASTYDRHARFQRLLLDKLAARAAAHVPLHGVWLDAGSGTGLLAQIAADFLRGPAVFVDLAWECLRVARARRPDAVRVLADIDTLPVKRCSIDVVTCSAVLQWSLTPEPALREFRRVMRPGGVLALGSFLRGSFAELSLVRSRLGIGDPIGLLSEQDLLASAKAAGFEIIDAESFEETLYYPTALRLLNAMVGTGSSAQPPQTAAPGGVLALASLYSREFSTEKGVPLTCRGLVAVARA